MPRGRGTGGRVGRGGGKGRRPREGNDERVNDLNGQKNNQGMGANGGITRVNGNVEGANGGAPDFSMIIAKQLHELLPAMLAQVRNVLVNGNRVGYSYKEFLACNPKEYDGKCCSSHSMDQENGEHIRTLSREVAISMSWNDFKFMMIEEFCYMKTKLWNHAMVGAGHAAYTDRFHELARSVPHLTMQKAVHISGALTDEAVRNGSIKKVEKKRNVGEPSKDKNGRDDNKRTRSGNVFATTVSPVGRENTDTWPKCVTYNSYHALGGPCRTCFNCNRTGHLAKDCRSVPRNVNPINPRNPPVRACYEYGSTDHGRRNQWNQARGRAFMLGAEEARQDSNIMTGIEPSDLGFRYEIEIASGQLEIDKVIKGCKLEIEGHVFDTDLISFGHVSFDVIIVRDFLEVFPDDPSGLPPIREIKFQIELIPRAVPVAKSPYRLAPSEL
nr:reverse transcriptase [Tanacetum cinerariifolium]